MGIYKLLLGFLHLLLYVRVILFIVVEKLKTFVTGFYGARGKSRSEIHLHSKEFPILPSHISFVILEPELWFTDLAQLIVWSMAMGISYISVYDRKGILKKSAAKLSSEIIYKQKQVFAEELGKYTFVLRTRRIKFDPSLAPTQVCISILSAEDGKRDIVEAAQDFCMAIEQKEAIPKQMEETLMNNMLKATQGIPDPELAVTFGTTDTVMGYLPWQTRLTEFCSFRTHYNIDYSTFLSSLHKYNRCEKRFGK